jgi:ferredoxin-NADP reductase
MVRVNGQMDRRSYSIVDSDPSGSRIAVSVFNSAHSRGGASFMHSLQPGDEIDITQPLVDFPLRVGAPSYVLLAGGIGITALMSMANVLRSTKSEYTLVYVGRSRAEMAYTERLAEEHGQRLQLHISDEGTRLHIPDLVAKISGDTELYMCGPIRLMDSIRRAWNDQGHEPTNLRFETFGNSGWFEAEEFRVRIPSLGVEVTVGPRQTMLEALQEAGTDPMFDCRRGECGLCEVRVTALEGEIDHRDVFYSERQRNARAKMCCCVSRAVAAPGARPGSAVVTIEPV